MHRAHPAPDHAPRGDPALMADTGLDSRILHDLVHGLYNRVRQDPMLGPVFSERITDWGHIWKRWSPSGIRSR